MDNLLAKDDIHSSYASYRRLIPRKSRFSLRVKLLMFIVLLTGVLLTPWTQNIRVPGKVTTLLPNQRPQTVPAAIDGRIEKWFIKEGDLVNRGDTLVTLSEINTQYLDPDILNRTDEQIKALKQTIIAFEQKINTLNNQLGVFEQQKEIKLKETRNKIKISRLKLEADSAALAAQNIQFAIADTQFKRINILYQDGLRSLSEFEARASNFQKNQAERTGLENEYQAAINELQLSQIQLSSIKVDFEEKFNNTRTDLEETRSKLYKAENDLAKLRNKQANITRRQSFYAVTAPQKGFITQAVKTGIGEIIKEGTHIVNILPYDIQIGIEMYVRPINMPLINKGNPVRVVFDGWPALVISGWPGTSVGSYPGRVWAIDRIPRKDGTYRILIEPAPEGKPWPKFLAMNSGAEAIALFQTVTLGYEMWRILNGFPPDFYAKSNSLQDDS